MKSEYYKHKRYGYEFAGIGTDSLLILFDDAIFVKLLRIWHFNWTTKLHSHTAAATSQENVQPGGISIFIHGQS